MVSTVFDMSESPQWAKDLRRGEVIAFGAFPFAYFFTNIGFDSYRWATHNWNTRYAPWPITSAGAIEKTQEQKVMTIAIAAGGAILISLVDYCIVRYKRARLQRETANLPDGNQIIIRTPLYDIADLEEPSSDDGYF